MSFERNFQDFNVIGTGTIREGHADDRHHNLGAAEQRAVGSAISWLAFYAIAALVVVSTSLSKTAPIALASSN